MITVPAHVIMNASVTIISKESYINEFLPLSDIDKIKEYDGFISTDGKFYPVSIKNKHNPTHHEWAYNYVTKKLDYIKKLSNPSNSFLYTISRLKSKQDILIHFYGYIYYGHDAFTKRPIIIYPDNTINNIYVTEKQLDMLFKVLKVNCEIDELYVNYEEKIIEDRHEKYVDELISKEIERNI